MKCSYCNKAANFKCTCQQPFMCKFHLGIHDKNHSYEILDEEIGDFGLSLPTSNLIKKVKMARNELASNSKSLIESIQRAFKQASDNLDSIIDSYFKLFNRFKFFVSESHFIEQIESLNINVRKTAVDSIKTLVQNTDSIELITFEKKELELTLVRSN